MKRAKHVKKSNVKSLSLILAIVLIAGGAIGGTLAWLTDKTDPIENTFTVGKVDIDLKETWNTASKEGGDKDSWTAKLIPGAEYAKNPKVTVSDDSEDCWLFVKFEENGDAAAYLDYTSTLTDENGWTQGDDTDIPKNVWYRAVGKNDTTKSWNLLEGDTANPDGCVIIKDTVTMDNMKDAQKAELVYTAYAVQKAGVDTASDAWAKLS